MVQDMAACHRGWVTGQEHIAPALGLLLTASLIPGANWSAGYWLWSPWWSRNSTTLEHQTEWLGFPLVFTYGKTIDLTELFLGHHPKCPASTVAAFGFPLLVLKVSGCSAPPNSLSEHEHPPRGFHFVRHLGSGFSMTAVVIPSGIFFRKIKQFFIKTSFLLVKQMVLSMYYLFRVKVLPFI